MHGCTVSTDLPTRDRSMFAFKSVAVHGVHYKVCRAMRGTAFACFGAQHGKSTCYIRIVC